MRAQVGGNDQSQLSQVDFGRSATERAFRIAHPPGGLYQTGGDPIRQAGPIVMALDIARLGAGGVAGAINDLPPGIDVGELTVQPGIAAQAPVVHPAVTVHRDGLQVGQGGPVVLAPPVEWDDVMTHGFVFLPPRSTSVGSGG